MTRLSARLRQGLGRRQRDLAITKFRSDAAREGIRPLPSAFPARANGRFSGVANLSYVDLKDLETTLCSGGKLFFDFFVPVSG